MKYTVCYATSSGHEHVEADNPLAAAVQYALRHPIASAISYERSYAVWEGRDEHTIPERARFFTLVIAPPLKGDNIPRVFHDYHRLK